ncbi:Potassium voltage-gated channel subfamily H member 2 (Ether-a-go-go-related gene potassium channel 1) (ERG-1) (Eag-related protein 1) (Ether-a-go-go-related protein 1) (MERG) (Voltage-gated potassium channel subunit Kv11.1), partial [Durusdinium trenchii]
MEHKELPSPYELPNAHSEEVSQDSDSHCTWKCERGVEELIDELGALHKDLKEAVRRQAHERDLQKVLKTTKPRPPQEQDMPSPPSEAELADLSPARKVQKKTAPRRNQVSIYSEQSLPHSVSGSPRLSQRRISALDRVQLVMRAAESFEEHIRKETEPDLLKASRFQMRSAFDLSDAELVEMKRRSITKNSSKVFTLLEQGPPRSKSSVEVAQDYRLSPSNNLFSVLPVHPSSRARIVWDFCAMFLLCYDLVIIPMQVFDMPDSAFLHLLSMVCTVYWTLDIVVSLNTAVYIHGKLVSDSRAIVRKYLKTWMALDVVLVVSDWLTAIVDAGAADPIGLARTLRSGRVVRMLRLARLLRFIKMKRLVDDVRRRASTEVVIFCVNVFQFFLSTALLTHVLACVWYLLGKTEEEGWVHIEGLTGNDLGTVYLMSMQWSLSRLHPISLRDNMKLKLPQERMFSLLASFGSLLFSSLFISYVTNTMAKLARLWKERSLKLAAVGEYAATHGVSTTLTVRLKKYVEHEEERRRYKENLEVLNSALPPELLRILLSAARSHGLSHHTLFEQMERKFHHVYDDICYEAVSEMYLIAGDIVFEPEVMSSRMYVCDAGTFLYCMDVASFGEGSVRLEPRPSRKGSCCRREQVLPAAEGCNAKDTTELSKGAFLSEAALWSASWQHTGRFSAGTDGRVLAIRADEFGRCVQRSAAAMCDVAIYARYFIQEMNHNWLNTD